MKVLVAHNRYRSDAPSGENVAVEAEIEALKSHTDVTVTRFDVTSDVLVSSAQKAAAGLGPIYSPTGVRRFRSTLKTERPDLVHLHNVFPLVSPWVIRVAVAAGVPVVQSVHNYRHSCAAGTHFRDGKPCFDCPSSGGPIPAVLHGCYRGSRLQSAAMAIGQVAHRGTWQLVSRFLAVSAHQADLLARLGLPRERIGIKPNVVQPMLVPRELGSNMLFVGRLEQSKGVMLLLDAWASLPRSAKPQLILAGDGPMRGAVAARAATDPSVRYVGLQDREGLEALLKDALAVVVPSLVGETFGLVAAEAMSAGRPVIATSSGALPELVTSDVGWIAEPSVPGLTEALSSALTDGLAPNKARAARARYEAKYSSKAVTHTLEQEYEALLKA